MADQESKPIRRFASDGRTPIETGGTVGPTTISRQRETNEERDERLEEFVASLPEGVIPTGEFPDASAGTPGPGYGWQPDAVDAMAVHAAAEAGARVEAASPTKEQRQAKAFVDELEARGVTLGDTHFHSDDDESATEEETLRLEAELELSGDDQEIGVDAAGNTIYLDAETNEQYVLVDE